MITLMMAYSIRRSVINVMFSALCFNVLGGLLLYGVKHGITYIIDQNRNMNRSAHKHAL